MSVESSLPVEEIHHPLDLGVLCLESPPRHDGPEDVDHRHPEVRVHLVISSVLLGPKLLNNFLSFLLNDSFQSNFPKSKIF